MKKQLLYSWLLAMLFCITGASNAWGQEYTDIATFNSGDVVTTSSYASTYNNSNWSITFGGNNRSIGTNKNNASKCRISQNYGTDASTSNIAAAVLSKNAIANVSRITFSYEGGAGNSGSKIYLAYSLDNSTWTAISLISGSQGANATTPMTFDFSTISSAYYAIILDKGNSTAANWRWDDVQIKFQRLATTPCATPTFSPAAGTYTSNQSVTISTATDGATIYYTTDGTTPSSSSTPYSSAITVSSTQTIKAIAVKDGNSNSEVATAAYTITSAVATTTTIDASGITNTDVYTSTIAGTLTASVTETESGDAVDGATVTWSGNNDAVATINANTGEVTLVGAGSVTFTASYAGVTDTYQASSDTYELTVTSSAPYVQPTSVTFNMNYEWLGSSNGGNLASGDLPVVKSQDNVTVTITDGTNTRPRGDGDYIRVYNGSTITFAAPSGYDITSIAFTAGGTGTWNAPTPDSGTLSDKTWSGTASSVEFSLSGSCFISSAEVTLTKQKVLSSIAVSGTYPTVFEVGDAFSHEGAVVTATYDDASNAVVTSSATFSTPDMSSAGVKTVTVSYTENAVEKTTTYDITVKAPAALESIALSGTYPTTFNVGDAFSHEGMTVTANFDDSSSADVTASATFTGYDMSTAGAQTVTVSYTHKGETTKTATYSITVNTVAVSSVTVAPASATVKTGKTVSLTPTVNPANATNKNVTWESNNPSVATVANGVVTGVTAGEATITVKSAADPTKSASCTVTVIAAGDGTKANPYDVAEALEIISGYSSGSGSDGSVYTKGIVSSVSSLYSSTMLTYFISIDGTGENTIQVFRGKNLGNTNFSATTDLSVGNEVIIYGQLYKYNTTSEINTGNYIYSLNGVKIPEITFGAASYEVAYNGSLTITATADGNGAITYSSSDNTVAEINTTTGVVTPHKTGEVTITANIAASDNNIAGSKGVTLTVTDGRASADIAFANASVTKTWGEAFTGQELTNPNSVAVTYESSEPTVATVNASGVVTIVKAGTTTITASFDGNEDYMPAEVSYTLTVNKAAAGLSFTTTAYDFDLNDDSFTGVAVNNPNSLTVTYESSDEDIALVDENYGTLVLNASAEGTVTITASFAGNDNYNAGNASYTITITDPDRKGTKKNPYTVAEVNSGSYSGNNYVKGYIVGFFTGKDQNAENSGNSNIALSDSPSEISGANTIAVQLPSGDIRTAWNIDDNNVVGYEVIVYGNITGYFTNKTGVKSTSEISAVSVPVKISSVKYATFHSAYALDFSEKATAYTAAYNSTLDNITLTEIDGGKVPANTPVVLYKSDADGTSFNVPVYTGDVDAITGNELRISDGTTATADNHVYVLSNKSHGVGFYRWAGASSLSAGKVYIQIPDGGSAREFFGMVEEASETTGIESLTPALSNSEGAQAVYDLQGRKVQNPKRGMYIINGKKVVIK